VGRQAAWSFGGGREKKERGGRQRLRDAFAGKAAIMRIVAGQQALRLFRHVPVLRAHSGWRAQRGLQRLGRRRHPDRFGTGAKNRQDFFCH